MLGKHKAGSYLKTIIVGILLLVTGLMAGKTDGVLLSVGELVCPAESGGLSWDYEAQALVSRTCLDDLEFGKNLALPTVVTLIILMLTRFGLLGTGASKRLGTLIVTVVVALLWAVFHELNISINSANTGLIVQFLYLLLGSAGTYELSRKAWSLDALKGFFLSQFETPASKAVKAKAAKAAKKAKAKV